jgi:AraC-like DNA-binding protein
VAADELRDRSVPLDALPVRWAGLGEQCRVGTTRGGVSSAVDLAGSGDLPGAGQALIAALAAAPHRRAPDPLAGAAAALLTDDPSLAAGDVARITSLSGRQLLRRCERSLGIGPKRYARIMRLQRFLAAGRRRPDLSLSELAFDTGYADHAHLAADCRELADRTPSALLGDRRAIAI